jgi:ATP-dependent RNA helicase HelY
VVLTEDRQVRKFAGSDFVDPPEPLQRLRVPKSFQSRDAQARRSLAQQLRGVDPPGGRRQKESTTDDAELMRLRTALRAHPCHGCVEREDHARWAERWQRLRKETNDLQRRVDNRTQSIARVFDRVVGVLEELGYLADDEVTEAGERLGRLYTELDLLAAECLPGSGPAKRLLPAACRRQAG